MQDFSEFVDKSLGPSDWITISQDMIDRFASVTGDRQWIHTDVARAAKEAPGGKTIAHGYLTMSLLMQLQDSIYQVEGARQAINYGANRVRFLSPVPVDSRVRLLQVIKSVERIEKNGVRIMIENTFELENAPRPALIMESIGLFFF
ncbi:MaoC family dehydratase [Bradyrhizobium sp. ma5]|uniref:MaoC family dehydratase n=1 Tax=Bradyrhizobium sp. ma5 TaxID=3344828 RepID=UPI0035D41FE2